jgi:hypothetical protein
VSEEGAIVLERLLAKSLPAAYSFVLDTHEETQRAKESLLKIGEKRAVHRD